MKRIYLIFFVILGLIGNNLFGQEIRVTGTVTQFSDGSTLPGVTVRVEGTSMGTVTDMDGEYTITVPSDAALVFSYIGMNTETVPVNNRSIIDVAMTSDLQALEEVIVVAYGTRTTQTRTGSVSVVSGEQMAESQANSPERALQGRLAGVQVNSPSGSPGATANITVRGVGSINAGTEPLWVVDGIAVATGDFGYATNSFNVLSNLNPNDIESITVLKDAAASSIYGSRAANGVILVTTKSGKAGKTRINARVEGGFSAPIMDNKGFRFMNPEEQLDYWRAAANNAGIDPDNPASGQFYFPRNLLSGELTNWWDEVFQDARTQEYEVSASGGNEKTTFFLSMNYKDQQGIQISSYMERYNIRANLDHKINDRFKFGFRFSGAKSELSDRFDGLAYGNPFWAAQSIFPWNNVRNEDGTFNYNIPENLNSNPVSMDALNERFDIMESVNTAVSLEINIFDGLTFKTNNSIDMRKTTGRDYRHPETGEGGGRETPNTINGQLFAANLDRLQLTTSNVLSYNKIFNDVHNVMALAGFEAENLETTSYTMQGYGIGADIPYLNNATSQQDVGYSYTARSLVSLFANAEYSYSGKYYIQASIRRDGSSRFGENNRFGIFPAVGMSWNMHNEDFLKNVSYLNLLKLRASFGTTGNWLIGNYETRGLYGTRSYNGTGGLAPASLAKPDLTWELTETYNLGLDLNLFGRLDASVDVYQRNTSDMLLDVPISQTSGFSNLRRNVGSMRNEGIELLLNGQVIRTPDMTWNVGGNIAFNRTRILDLAGEAVVGDGFFRRYRAYGEEGNEDYEYGLSHYYVYDWAGVNPLTGMGLWYDEDGNLSENYNNARRVYRGKSDPDFFGGLTTSFSWKGISVNALFEYKVGHYVKVMERRYVDSDAFSFQTHSSNSLDYWKEPGDVVATPKPIANNNSESNAWGTSRFLEKGDYLRFKELSVSYTLPKLISDNIRAERIRLYASAYNLYTWHDVSYFDPERDARGGGYALYPNPFTMAFGVDVGF